MFNVGGGELLVIVLLALIVLGPDKLPGAMRTLGGWIGEMRKIASGFQAEMHKAVDQATSAATTDETAPGGPAKAGDATPSTRSSNGNGDGAGGARTNGSSPAPAARGAGEDGGAGGAGGAGAADAPADEPADG